MPRFPFSPQVLDSLPEELAELFRGLELTLLKEICSRLKISDQLNEVTVDDIRALRAHGIDLKDIEKAIRDVTGISQNKLDKLLDDVVERNQAYYTELITLAQVTEPQTLVDQADIDAIKAQCQREFGNITRSMGFLVDNGRTMLPPARAYQHCLDMAELKISSGAISYNEAIRQAVRELADSGLMVPHNNESNWVQYESGWYNRADVAARRAVMTAVVQVNAKYREQSMDYLGTDLVECTAHSGARDTGVGPANHKSWHGKIYRWSEKPRTSQGEYKDFVETTGYGTGEGLCGWNCRHSFFPFLENVMEPTYTQEQLDNIDPPPIEYDGKTYTAYESTQAQRRIEASIRRWKRRKIAAEASGDKDDANAAGARLRALNKKYREFSKAAGLPEQRERMRVEYV